MARARPAARVPAAAWRHAAPIPRLRACDTRLGAAPAGIAASLDDREGDLLALGLSVEGLVVQQRDDLVLEEDGGTSLLHDLVRFGGLRGERQLEGAWPLGAIRDADTG